MVTCRDFNDIKAPKEQRGGGMINERKCQRFATNINRCDLIDLGSEGHKFTWKWPMVQHASRLYKKLDRAMCNVSWRNNFSEAWVKVGPRINSDHHPLMIYLQQDIRRNNGERPFRFEAMWVTHQNFTPMLKNTWKGSQEVRKDLEEFEKVLKDGNTSVFGHVAKRKELLRRIEGIQRSPQYHDNPCLEELERDLSEELRTVLQQEEVMWFQKARTKWLNDGDRNTSYYHTKTNVRRRRNRVMTLRGVDGQWIEGRDEVG